MKRETTVESILLKRRISGFLFALATFAFVALMSLPVIAQKTAKGTAAVNQTTFATAQEAAEALVAAAEKYDQAALAQILGPDGRDILNTGEPAHDKETALEFAALARKKMSVIPFPRNRLRSSLTIGEDNWAFPIPIVKQRGRWLFDTPAGRQEILYRRIGRNELTAIDAARGYVEAQHEYALTKHDGALVNQYAQRIISTSGKHDGLAWQNADGTWGGTVGERAAKELEKTYTGKREPFHGYYFKVLKGQGPAAPLGQLDYMQKGAMIGGFALLAYPATYRVTGVKSFIVSQDGVVYEKDLGTNTLKIAEAIDRFNPDRTWSPVFEDEEVTSKSNASANPK